MNPKIDFAKLYVLGYVEARSLSSSKHKLPTRDEILNGTAMFTAGEKSAVLDELVKEKSIHTDGINFSTLTLERYPL